jgi:hypothetical protein
MHEDEVRIWAPLGKVFQKRGLVLWPVAFESVLKSPNDVFPLQNGYAYVSSSRTAADGIGTASRLRRFTYIVRAH